MPGTIQRSRSASSALPQRRFTQEEYFAMAEAGIFGEDDSIESEYRQRRTHSADEAVTPRFEEVPSFDVEALLPARSS